MSNSNRRARERQEFQKRQNQKLQKASNLRKQFSHLKVFTVQLNCGCCDEEVFFASDADIATEFNKLGLTSSGSLVDRVGREVQGVDTFYGFRSSDEPHRKFEYLLRQLKKQL